MAQSMIQHDKATAVFRLGISQDVAELIEALTPAQILKLAASGMMVSRFRFDDGALECEAVVAGSEAVRRIEVDGRASYLGPHPREMSLQAVLVTELMLFIPPIAAGVLLLLASLRRQPQQGNAASA